MKVSELMTQDVETVTPDTTLQDAARLMARIDAGVLPVVENGRLSGIVTDRDITIRAVAEGRDIAITSAGDIMSPEVKYVFDDEEVSEVAETMADLQVRRLPVLDRARRVVGIVSLGDLARDERPRRVGEALQGITRPGGQHND
jgi:CBS domain-containing protein